MHYLSGRDGVRFADSSPAIWPPAIRSNKQSAVVNCAGDMPDALYNRTVIPGIDSPRKERRNGPGRERTDISRSIRYNAKKIVRNAATEVVRAAS